MPIHIQIDYSLATNPNFFTPDKRSAIESAAKTWESYLTNEEFTDITFKESSSDLVNRSFIIGDPNNPSSQIPITLSQNIDDLVIYVGSTNFLPVVTSSGITYEYGRTVATVQSLNTGNQVVFKPHLDSRAKGLLTYEPYIASIAFNNLQATNQIWWTDPVNSVKYNPTVLKDSNGNPFIVGGKTFPVNQYIDLYSLALHEIGHALGFNNQNPFTSRISSPQLTYAYSSLPGSPIIASLSSDGVHVAAVSSGIPDLMGADAGSYLAQVNSQTKKGNRIANPSQLDLNVLASLGYNVSGAGFPTFLPNGTSVQDVFSATSNNDNLDGLGGDDLINGADGLDSIRGGLGNDTLLGGSGNDNLSGDDGNDSLFGDIEVLGFSSLSGNDTINGGKGNDSLYGGYGDDSLVGGDDDDYLDGGPGKDTIDGGKGNDTVKIDSSDPVVVNVENRQAAAGSGGNDTLYGSKGNDIMRGGNDADRLEGLEGNDTLYGGGTQGETTAGKDTLYGGDGNDLLVSNIPFAVTQKDLPSSTYTAGEDTLDGGIGNDTLLGGTNTADKTTMYGGDGNDTIIAQSGQAFIYGGIGNDSIRGGSNTTFNGNTANGDDGNDTIEAGSGGMAGATLSLQDKVIFFGLATAMQVMPKFRNLKMGIFSNLIILAVAILQRSLVRTLTLHTMVI